MAGFWDFIPKLLPTVISGGATLYGAQLSSDATKSAAKTTTAASQAAAAAQTESLKRAEEIIKSQQAAASPGLIAMQNIVGRGEQLTPAQLTALGDARRTTLDSLQGGSVRGSARATAETVKKVEGDMRNTYLDKNRATSDNAAANLSNQYFNSGNTIAGLNTQSGTVASQNLMNAGNINAASDLGQANIQGKAIGDIGALIAGSLKDEMSKKRESSYTAPKEQA